MARQYLTERERAAILQQQGGTCCTPGCTATEGLQGEHSTPSVWVGGKPDQLMCVPCHKAKTRRDIKAIAKVKRLRGETCTRRGRPIRSPGFRGHRKFDGTPVWKDRT